MHSTPTVTLCGPQRLKPTIGAVAQQLQLKGPVGIITAGWREREPDDSELRDALALKGRNLGLYARWKTVADADPEYFSLHRKRQDQLRALQRLYRRRLAHQMEAARAMHSADGPDELVTEERLSAIDMIAELDRHHLRRVKQMHVDFQQQVRPGERPAIARQRAEVTELLDDCDAVCIAGGHVAVLLNRLRLFALRSQLAARHVIAWSAGAMAMTSHVLLFHDFPPWGAGDAEVLDHGLGLAPGIVALPHAHRRLALEDRQRVAAMARRAAPSVCLAMPDGSSVITREGAIEAASDGIQQLTEAGDLAALATAQEVA